MQNLLKSIPTLTEYKSMDEEQREILCLGLNRGSTFNDLPEKVSEYHPVEITAYMASKYGFILDLIEEFDLTIDYNESIVNLL